MLLSVLAVLFLFWRGIYSVNVRYLGLNEFLNVGAISVVVALSQFGMPSVVTGGNKLIETILFGFFVLTSLSGVRIVQRIYSWRTRHSATSKDSSPKRTIIVGAGDAAETILREINRSAHPLHNVVGFVDDDTSKAWQRIHGAPVLGSTEEIPVLVKELHIQEILIAMPSASGEEMRRVSNLCQQTGARVRTLPAVKALLSGGGPQLYSHFRDIEIEDLLRRDPVQTDLDGIQKYIRGQRVLITGGGGSIGSELARQIARLNPASLILLGKGENSIYEIEQELLQTNRFQPNSVIADVRDRLALERVFEQYRPTVVFHAAAHKHVPLMQANPIEAIRNNILGTRQVAELSVKYGVKRFINVSTDKAVNPSSIMGATKRVGEMIVAALGSRYETEFGIVRFGNVMGSRGSLIPMLKAQIRRGGPVRVTHPDMTRYFMTIPEAVQLILQAGVLGKRGEIFILDMGEPIKILDLAMDLIRLHGLVPGEDIEVQFTGVRPGEKIEEELMYDDEELGETPHPKISMVQRSGPADWEWLKEEINNLLRICEEGYADEARHTLMELALGKSSAPFHVASHDPEKTDRIADNPIGL
ncbi:MAG: nucleoside-diphosphate sugar epimerase/dehydratase [Fimbriimonadaceae bacterium]